MNVASLELCKELYELCVWSDTYNWWREGDLVSLGSFGGNDVPPEAVWSGDSFTPAYTLGYLLRKLPNADKEGIHAHFSVASLGKKYAAYWECDTGEYYTAEQYTPEDAVTKLTIELFKQNILTKET